MAPEPVLPASSRQSTSGSGMTQLDTLSPSDLETTRRMSLQSPDMVESVLGPSLSQVGEKSLLDQSDFDDFYIKWNVQEQL